MFSSAFSAAIIAAFTLTPEQNPLGLKAYKSDLYSKTKSSDATPAQGLVVHSSQGAVEPHNFCEAYSGTMFRGHTIPMQPPEGSNVWGNPRLETIIAATIRKNDSSWNRFWGLHELQQWTWGNTNPWGRNVAMGSVYVPRGYVLELYNNINYEPSGGGLIVAGARLQDLEDYAPQINSMRCIRTNEDNSFVFPM